MRLDDDYANAAHIPDGSSYYGWWDAAAARFRDVHSKAEFAVSYGASSRQVFDLFHPLGPSKGTVIFVHGGYWMAGSAGMFSHLAAGSVRSGYSCAVLGYSLTPDVRIAQITREIATGVAAIAARTAGPIYLVGHSAGGHLVARMGCADVVADWGARVARIMPISPLGDLGPLLETSMNATLRLDAVEVEAESPVRHSAPEIPVHVWVGAREIPVFLAQAKRLQQAWGCDLTIEPERHHFDVIDGLAVPQSAILQTLFR